MIKVVLLLFFFGNLLYVTISVLLGDISYIEEVLLETGLYVMAGLIF